MQFTGLGAGAVWWVQRTTGRLPIMWKRAGDEIGGAARGKARRGFVPQGLVDRGWDFGLANGKQLEFKRFPPSPDFNDMSKDNQQNYLFRDC